MIRSIELECVPGGSHPSDLIMDVVNGTVLENFTNPEDISFQFNNDKHCRWKYPLVNEKAYLRDRPILKERIMSLYDEGIIKYGSW